MKVPLSEQIDAVAVAGGRCRDPINALALNAALATLKWVEKHQAELRVLAEFPGASVVRRDEK